jgi:hypothetical protein
MGNNCKSKKSPVEYAVSGSLRTLAWVTTRRPAGLRSAKENGMLKNVLSGTNGIALTSRKFI